MSPELTFILLLALRMAVTAAFVVTASVITERSGPVIGALVATLPISAGPSYVFLALDHDAGFIAEGALASLPINAATIFSRPDLCGAGAAPQCAEEFCRRGHGVDRAGPHFSRTVQWSLAGGLLANAVTFAICLPLMRALSPRQDAADHPALVRYSAARPRWSRHWWRPLSRCRAGSVPASAA